MRAKQVTDSAEDMSMLDIDDDLDLENDPSTFSVIIVQQHINDSGPLGCFVKNVMSG